MIPWILVVDDDADIREVVVCVLESHGWRAVPAGDARRALEQVRQHGPPALVLLDLFMPDVNGVQFSRWLRADPALAQVPIVILTGDVRAAEAALGLRAVGVLQKPVELDELLAMVRAFVPLSA